MRPTTRSHLGRICSPLNFAFPSVEVPGRSSATQSGDLGRRRSASRVQSRFDEAVRSLAEAAFTAELAKLVSHFDRTAQAGRRTASQKRFAIGRRQPDRVLRAIPPIERPPQRAASTSLVGRRPADHSRHRAARPYETTPACGSTWPRKCPRCRERGRWHVGGAAAAGHPPSAGSDDDGHAAHHRCLAGWLSASMASRST